MSLLIDVLLAVCLVLTMIAGVRGGFFRELFALVGVAAGVSAGLRLTPLVQLRLPAFFQHSVAVWIALFLALFFVTYFLASLLGLAFAALWEGKKPTGLSRGLGLALGAFRGFVLVLFLAGAIVLIAPEGSPQLARSRILPYLSPGISWASQILPGPARDRLVQRWNLLPFPGERGVQPDLPSSAGGGLPTV